MVKHIILWQLKDELSPSEKEIRKQKIKESLESLPGKVPGLSPLFRHLCIIVSGS